MSTRCNIIVMKEGKVIQFYHHCDGYPEGVGMKLKELADVAELITPYKYSLAFGRIYNECIWDCFLGLIKQAEQYANEGEIEKPDYDLLHGDIEYLYLVRVSTEGINVEFKPWGSSERNDKEAIKELNLGCTTKFKNIKLKLKLD